MLLGQVHQYSQAWIRLIGFQKRPILSMDPVLLKGFAFVEYPVFIRKD